MSFCTGNMFAKEGARFQSAHLVQSVILLWDFCRRAENGVSEVQGIIKAHGQFEELLAKLLESVENLNPNEMTCCFLYLKRIGLNSEHKIIQDLLFSILEKIRKGENIPLSALSRFCVAIGTDKIFNTSFVGKNMLPQVIKALETCVTAEEIRLITICLINVRQLVVAEILESYKSKVQQLMKLDIINTESTKCSLKILNFLNHPSWSHRNSELSRQLMLLIMPVVHDLSEEDVKTAYRIYQSQLEPAAIAPKLLKVSETLLEKHPTEEMLTCIVQFAEPKKKERLIEIFQKQLSNESMWQRQTAPFYFFTILRSLKISDSALCNQYWNKVLEDLEKNPEGKEHYVFSRHCHRYMYFNNNLGGTYRHYDFEKRMAHLCMNEIENGISSMIPSKFASIASFVLGYGHTYRGNSMIPSVILSKIETMKYQFSPDDCLQLSRGIQIAFEMRFRHFVPTILGQQLGIIEKALCESAQRHLDTLSDDNAKDLNVIVRALNNRKSPKKSSIYQQALNKYNHIKPDTLNSRLLRNMSYNLSTSNFVAPEILEKMFTYIMENEEYVTGDTAEKIISCSYNLGYSPQMQEYLDSISRIVMRDFNYMTGLSIIQACLALCFYKTIPETLINKVFCVHFIKRIEEEIEMCYSKATYPERVLNQVMQLNRAVCLDFPEVDVPWFQQNYLEAQLSKYPFVPSRYNDDVKQVLLSLLKDESLFRCNHVTPYGYRFFRKLTSSTKSPVTKLEDESLRSRQIQKCQVDSDNDLCQQKIPMRCPYTISAKISNPRNKNKLNSRSNRTDSSSQSETKSTNFMVSSQYVSKLETYLSSARQTMNPNLLACDVHGVRSFRLLSEEDTSNDYSTHRCSAGIVFEKVKYRENIRYFRRTPSNSSLSSYPSSPKTIDYHKEYLCSLNEKKKENNNNKKSTYTQSRQSNIFLQFRNNISHPVNLKLSSNPSGNLNNLVISEGRNWLNEPCPVVSWDINGNSIDDDIVCLNNNWDDCDNRMNLLRDKRLLKTRLDGSFKSSSRSSSTTLETWVDDEILDNSYNEEIERQFRI
ncbi:FAST kinase domain-containing protein 1, mitochondrial-like isoform X2 [Episyrphus balteatus]|uniref:FAST kinase domain-containing protein 1, mitochondrial-like isoform X2 n=1 Tax=Episyrphus balteatus TaxID=286459 RepID=UPI002485B94D|nr:FAST kinase domain-containing protein 1, mitochondrial-like isoform X2 [Episyrphus balteatus]